MTAHEQGISLKRTPLYEQHRTLGARLVEFGGWEMPVQYSSILEEHEAVRTHAGLFDVSHMGEFKVEGAGVLAFLQSLVPNDVAKLAIHQALYTQFCKLDGNVIDDLLIYRLAEEQYMLVVNASNIDKDLVWVKEHGKHVQDVLITDQSDFTALLALQGPEAQAILQSLTETNLADIRYYHCEAGLIDGINCLISRTGYTGEDGFELYCAPVDVVELWQKLLTTGKSHGLLPAGLGARDTLRLEAALCLYGHELDEQTNPLEASLSWTVKLKKPETFIGRDALQQVKEQGPQKRLVGIEMVDRGIARGGYALYDNEQQIGIVTSGAPGPTVHKNIAMGYVDAAHATVGSTLQVDVRGKRLAAQIVPLPFYKTSKVRAIKGERHMAKLNHPENLKYSKTDEWIRIEGNLATIGISDYAQDQLGDIVYIELPWDANENIAHEAKFGDIESVKATSELLSPLSGKIVKVNTNLKDTPELINDHPYEAGWMLVVEMSDPAELVNHMSTEEYLQYIQGR